MTNEAIPATPPTSNPVLVRTLVWGGAVALGLMILSAIIGFAVAGTNGLWSGVVGVGLAAVFLALTALSILIANRWSGSELYMPIFFGLVLGGWFLKLIIFIVVMLLLRSADWVHPQVLFFSLIAGVLTTLIIDALVVWKTRMPTVSELILPTKNPEDD